MPAAVATPSAPNKIVFGFQFHPKAQILFTPAPYKVLHGGRAATKTWDFCQALLILGANRKLFIVCAREIQKSIKESVHKTLADRIRDKGMELRTDEKGRRVGVYKILDTEIRGINGTRIVFVGIRNNVAAIKSMEGIDIFAVFEATSVTKHSWEIVLPTVRRPAPFGPFGQGSEIWIEFNPELDTDETYKRWVADPPEGAIVVEMNWRDADSRGWFSEFSRKLKDDAQRRDESEYLTVWEGKTRRSLQGAIYAKELAAAIIEGRISPHVRHVTGRPVIVTFDLGRSDMCALWFWQQIGMEHHAIDWYENCGYDFSHYLQEIQARKYLIGGIWLPHDGAHETIAATKSVEKQARAAYPTPGIVKIVPRVSYTTKINAMRQLFPRIYINETACSGGVLSLQHYQFGVNAENKQRTKEPLHNWASHSSVSAEYYAVQLREGNKKEQERETSERDRSGDASPQGWMM
jgi:phage terminase large subunit